MDLRRLLSVAVLVLLAPVLQGAGCRTHYSARLHGTVAVADSAEAKHAGKPVRIIYRRHGEATRQCTDDWVPCLRESGWQILKECDALGPTEGKTPNATAPAGATELRFDACTQMIGVDYRADVAAFVDLDGGGTLGPGEPFGVFPGNPLTRDQEATVLPLRIRLDQTMPPE